MDEAVDIWYWPMTNLESQRTQKGSENRERKEIGLH